MILLNIILIIHKVIHSYASNKITSTSDITIKDCSTEITSILPNHYNIQHDSNVLRK